MRILENNLILVRGLLRKDYDWMHVNVGYERSGKSTLSIEECTIVDPTFDERRITFTTNEFKKMVEKAKPYQAVLADEGAEAFFSKDAMKADNVEVQRILTKIGKLNLFIVINVPDYFLLDPYVRGHRIRSLTRVISRGNLAFYSKQQIARIYRSDETRTTVYPEPNFFDTFQPMCKQYHILMANIHDTDTARNVNICTTCRYFKTKCLVPLWKSYQLKKLEYLNRKPEAAKLQEKADEIIERTFTIGDTSRLLKVPRSTIVSWLNRNRLKALRAPSGVRRIPKSEIERILGFYGKQQAKIKASLQKIEEKQDRMIEDL